MTTAGLGTTRGRALTVCPEDPTGLRKTAPAAQTLPHSAPTPPARPEPALTSSVPQDGDPQAEPGADTGAEQEAGACLSHQNFALQGPTWKRLG